MAAKFDNLDDVSTKFVNTICYYEDKPVMVKGASHSELTPGEFALTIVVLGGRNRHFNIELNDEKFRYRDYNLGYVNEGESATWWYRKPLKQYSQGLRSNQMGYKAYNTQMHEEFGWSKPYAEMLANVYPSLEQVQAWLKEGNKKIVAFHKDFAVAWDEIHNDYLLFYRAEPIGNSQYLRDFNLLKGSKHLTEALKEAIG